MSKIYFLMERLTRISTRSNFQIHLKLTYGVCFYQLWSKSNSLSLVWQDCRVFALLWFFNLVFNCRILAFLCFVHEKEASMWLFCYRWKTWYHQKQWCRGCKDSGWILSLSWIRNEACKRCTSCFSRRLY